MRTTSIAIKLPAVDRRVSALQQEHLKTVIQIVALFHCSSGKDRVWTMVDGMNCKLLLWICSYSALLHLAV